MNKNIIEKGDRIFARLSMGGRTIVEVMMNSISSIDEVTAELRRLSGDIRGLVKLYIRNHTRGWCVERGLMVYNREGAFRDRPKADGVLPLVFDEMPSMSQSRMLSPWETH
ncbi:MAG: hypothetical protein K2J82_03655 [Muribaculaceae bacterium]|nr:hypothetical protein [Muribaculaceae bacterium]MDE6753689.1 hypothetical protein [Muribaculaceae bacterium]